MIKKLLGSVKVSDYDSKPIKNKLPPELREKFLTRQQWEDLQMEIKKGAEPVAMHPNAMSKKLCYYYYIDDVQQF